MALCSGPLPADGGKAQARLRLWYWAAIPDSSQGNTVSVDACKGESDVWTTLGKVILTNNGIGSWTPISTIVDIPEHYAQLRVRVAEDGTAG